jgi:hypothetical protein
MHTEVRGTTRVITLRRDDIDTRFPGLLDAVQVTAPAAALTPGGVANLRVASETWVR